MKAWLKRLEFLVVLVTLPLSGCGEGDASVAIPPDYVDIPVEENLRMRESPLLAARVEHGALPPVEERLPENPMVVSPVEQPGLYGGTWRHYHVTIEMLTVRLISNYYGLTRWKPDVSGLMPGLATDWSWSEDGRTATFHLRQGVKWSNGDAFTSHDVLFWWELCLDPRVAIVPPQWAYSAGEPIDVQAPDDQTLIFRFKEPYYFIDIQFATGFWTPEDMILPSNYLRRFHPDHSDYEDFNTLLRKNNVYDNPERPTLAPWQLTYTSPTGDRVVLERNPYYWAVDSNGRQLPYIDRIVSYRVQNAETGVLMIIAGQIDAQFREIGKGDYALLRQFAETRNYRVERWEEGTGAWDGIFLNWTVDDPERRELFRNRWFRRALSHAIDREMINQVVWHGVTRPQGGAITDEAWHFRSERGRDILRRWIEKWSEHDPEVAKEYLDRAGMSERDAQGFRMWRGKPFELVLESFDNDISADQAEIIEANWEAVGVRTRYIRAMLTDLTTRKNEGKYDAYMWRAAELDLFTFPGYVFPTDPQTWHPKVGKWYSTGGKEGVEPEGITKTLLDMYETAKTVRELEARHDIVLDAIELHLEEGPFWLGTTGRQMALVVLKDYFKNVPKTGILGPWATVAPASLFSEQFYIDIYEKAGVEGE